jgi:hypothetical protein
MLNVVMDALIRDDKNGPADRQGALLALAAASLG